MFYDKRRQKASCHWLNTNLLFEESLCWKFGQPKAELASEKKKRYKSFWICVCCTEMRQRNPVLSFASKIRLLEQKLWRLARFNFVDSSRRRVILRWPALQWTSDDCKGTVNVENSCIAWYPFGILVQFMNRSCDRVGYKNEVVNECMKMWEKWFIRCRINAHWRSKVDTIERVAIVKLSR